MDMEEEEDTQPLSEIKKNVPKNFGGIRRLRKTLFPSKPHLTQPLLITRWHEGLLLHLFSRVYRVSNGTCLGPFAYA